MPLANGRRCLPSINTHKISYLAFSVIVGIYLLSTRHQFLYQLDVATTGSSINHRLLASVSDMNLREAGRAQASVTVASLASRRPSTFSKLPFDAKNQTLLDYVGGRALNGTIMVVPFNFGYKSMLLNFMCRLAELHMTNYVAIALDDQAWSLCQNMSLPCIPPHRPGKASRVGKAYKFGTRGFQALTGSKPTVVLSILKLGFNVLLSDVENYFKQNPLEQLSHLGSHHDIIIQSDEPEGNADLTRKNRMGLNSGFYLVQASNRTIAALEAIDIMIKKGQSYASDQPAFHKVLCGRDGQYVRNTTCYNPGFSVSTYVLGREQWPNGGQPGVRTHRIKAKSVDSVAIVHFNYLVGKEAKKKSMCKSDMWLLDGKDRCPYMRARGQRFMSEYTGKFDTGC